MTTLEMKDTSFELQGVAMNVKANLIALHVYPDQVPDSQALIFQTITQLDLLMSLALDVRKSLETL